MISLNEVLVDSGIITTYVILRKYNLTLRRTVVF